MRNILIVMGSSFGGAAFLTGLVNLWFEIRERRRLKRRIHAFQPNVGGRLGRVENPRAYGFAKIVIIPGRPQPQGVLQGVPGPLLCESPLAYNATVASR